MIGAGMNHNQVEDPIDCSSEEHNPKLKLLKNRLTKQAGTIENLAKQLKKAYRKGGNDLGLSDDTDRRFPKAMDSFTGGMAAVDRQEFAQRFDMGIPLDKSEAKNNQVLLFYSNEKALPTSDPLKAEEAKSYTGIPYMDDIDVATENCEILNVILAQPNDKQQCFAMMGQYRSHHLQKFMRLPEDGGKVDRHVPLRLVNRGAQTSGRLSARSPSRQQTVDYWNTLSTYLQNLDDTLAELQRVAADVAKDNTIIVMTVNHGQVELLMNFVCSCEAKGVDISALLIFATDQETVELARGMGLNVFFDEKVCNSQA
jgi:hypothetical protein